MKTREFKDTVEFTNNGQLSLFFIGSGSAFSKKYFQNNLLVIKGNDHVLIDCGTLCPFAFSQFNGKISDIKNLLITHTHADHAGGLEEVALMNMYVTGTKPNMVINDDFKKILWKQTLKGGLGLKGESMPNPRMTFDDYFIQIRPKKIKKSPRPFFEVNVGSINLKLFRTKHLFTKKDTWRSAYYSVGVLIDDRILFSGDTQADKEVIDWLTSEFKIDYIFHDCQFANNAVHTSFEELCRIIPRSYREKTFLCHYSDNADQKNSLVLSEGFAGCVQRGVYYDL